MGTASVVLVILAALGGCGGDQQETADAATVDLAAEGEQVAGRSCLVCHSVDGSDRSGPTFLGGWGGTVTSRDGSTATFDRPYLERATIEPGARVVEGYSNAMPPSELRDEEFDALEAYVRTLADG